MSDPSPVDHLFPPGDDASTSAEALYRRVRERWPSGGDLLPWDNPVMRIDNSGTGDGLGEWFRTAWKSFRESVGAGSKLPPEARFDKDWADKKAGDVGKALDALEHTETSSKRRRGELADQAISRLMELHDNLPLDALAAVRDRPDMTTKATTLRDVSFAAALGAVARSISERADVDQVFLDLALSDTAERLIELGGEAPEALQLGNKQEGHRYLLYATQGLQVHLPGDGQEFGRLFGDYLSQAKEAKKYFGRETKGSFRDQELARDKIRAYKFKVGDMAHVTHALSRHARDLAQTPGAEAELVQVLAMAMVCGEAMRDITGAVRSDASSEWLKDLSEEQRKDRTQAARESAVALRQEFSEEREVREPAHR